MKLADSLIFSLTVALFLIGIDQTFRVGITQSYWIFMGSLGFLMWYRYRKTSRVESNQNDQVKQSQKTGRKKAKAKRNKKR